MSTPHNEQSLVDEAVKVFVTARSHVAPHLYDDVLPCLQWLKEEMGMNIAVVTNGNAEGLHLCDTLGKYVSLSISATDVGVMKPSPVPFLAVSQRTGVTPDRILFVGDSHDKDVLGAQATGMVGVLIARGCDDNGNGSSRIVDNAGSIGTATDTAVAQIRELMNDDKQIVLSTLIPTEFQQKVERFLARRRES
jgi:HAD superfamily hydrolase (TIGR01509 family)